MKQKINWKVLIISLIIVYGVAFIGSLFTSSAVNSSWYESIKPSITPPGWVFPIVWNILFLFISISLYLAWISSKKKDDKNHVAVAFGLNLILNVLWSYIFFYLQNPRIAFFELILLWVSIVFMIATTYRINKKASYLLIPYLVWVGFAGILNLLIAF